VGLEFSPANASYHPVAQALPATDPGANGSSRLTAAQLKASAGWWPGETMYCSDCHGNDAASPASQGPHGSAVNYMLKGPNTLWPPTTMFNSGSNLGQVFATTFCYNCHPGNDGGTYGGNKAHQDHATRAITCYNCHIIVPHGAKMSRLIGDGDSAGMPNRYAYQGVKSNLWVTSFTKVTPPGSYTETACGSNYSGCSGKHGTAASENW
jgi:hypothetical protein